MPITLNGSTGITSPEVILDNTSADGGQVVLKSSGFDNWNIDNFSGNLRAYYNATEQMRVTPAGLLQFNSGYGSVATAYGCRAWVSFNGTGTVAIRASGNVSSVTDLGVGSYRVNFTNAMPDINYSTSVACAGAGGAWIASMGSDAGYPATGSVGVFSGYANSWTVDAPHVMVSVFR